MCAWLEGTFAGCAVLGPDFEEWRRPGIANYSDQDSFYNQMKSLINNDDLRLELQKMSVDTIVEQKLTLKDTAKSKVELLKQYS